MQNEVIVEVLAECGSRVLYGLRLIDGWFFSLDFIDPDSSRLLNAEENEPAPVVTSFADGLTLLDRYPWTKLVPGLLHPDFRKEILNAFLAREAETPTASRYHDEWIERCAEHGDENLKRYKVFASITGSDDWMYDGLD